MSLYLPPAGYYSIHHYDPNAIPQDDLWPNRGDPGLHPCPSLFSRPWRCSWGDLHPMICCYSWDSATEEWEQNSNESQRHSARILRDTRRPARPLLSDMPTANHAAAQTTTIKARFIVAQNFSDILPSLSNVSFRAPTCGTSLSDLPRAGGSQVNYHPTSTVNKNDVTPVTMSSSPASSEEIDGVEPSLPGAILEYGKALPRAASS